MDAIKKTQDDQVIREFLADERIIDEAWIVDEHPGISKYLGKLVYTSTCFLYSQGHVTESCPMF